MTIKIYVLLGSKLDFATLVSALVPVEHHVAHLRYFVRVVIAFETALSLCVRAPSETSTYSPQRFVLGSVRYNLVFAKFPLRAHVLGDLSKRYGRYSTLFISFLCAFDICDRLLDVHPTPRQDVRCCVIEFFYHSYLSSFPPNIAR